MHRPSMLACLLIACSAALGAACGPPKEIESPHKKRSASTEIECPDPIGTIPREDCTAIGAEFEVLSVSGAMQHTGSDALAARRVDAIRATAALANQLKEDRISLCEAYNACSITPAEHTAKDKALSDRMGSLLELWDARNFTDLEAVARFHASVRALAGAQPVGPSTAGPAKSGGTVLAGDKLAQLAAPGVNFSAAGGAVTVRAQDGGPRQVLRSAPELRLRGGRRYLVKMTGSYAPAVPPLLAGGDEVIGKVRYRATQAVEVYAALRSLGDPEASESTTSWRVAAGEKGAHEAPLTARPGDSGFYLAVGARGSGAVTFDDVELLRGSAVLAAARAEANAEPMVTTSCRADTAQPLAGKRSFRCEAGAADLVTLGMPGAYVELTVRSASGDRAMMRTQSLEGGRSLDAALTEDAELVVTLAGAGTLTVKSIEVHAVEP